MKKILSMFAFVAMLCIPLCLVSCGDDDDPVSSGTQGGNNSSSNTQGGSYTLDVQGTESSIQEVFDFVKDKLGTYVVKIEGTSMVVTNKTAVKTLLNDFGKYKADLDAIVEKYSLPAFHLIIKDQLEPIYKYEYTKAAKLITYGTYTYTDSEGLVWEFTYTDKDAGDGTKVGSLVVPKDVESIKAGTYEGTCKANSITVEFNSTAIYARFGLMYDEGTPAYVKISDTAVINKEFFKKTK